MSEFLQGATAAFGFAICVFFVRYWRDTGDRLFAVFAAAFALFGASRVVLASLDRESEARIWVYALRAGAFLAIAAAIVDKNVSGSSPSSPGTDADGLE